MMHSYLSMEESDVACSLIPYMSGWANISSPNGCVKSSKID